MRRRMRSGIGGRTGVKTLCGSRIDSLSCQMAWLMSSPVRHFDIDIDLWEAEDNFALRNRSRRHFFRQMFMDYYNLKMSRWWTPSRHLQTNWVNDRRLLKKRSMRRRFILAISSYFQSNVMNPDYSIKSIIIHQVFTPEISLYLSSSFLLLPTQNDHRKSPLSYAFVCFSTSLSNDCDWNCLGCRCTDTMWVERWRCTKG